MELEELKSMTPALANQLMKIGIISVESLVIRSITEIKEKLQNISGEKLKVVYKEAWISQGLWFSPLNEADKIRGERKAYTTGSKALDKLLGSGLHTREITEFAGQFGSGKSQILFTAAIECLASNLDGTMIFFDTEDTARKERFGEIAEKRGYKKEDILGRIIYIPIADSDHYAEALDAIEPTIKSRNVKMIMTDSALGTLRAEYVGRELLWQRQQMLNKMLRRQLNLAKIYNLVVAVSNQVVANPQAMFTYDPIQQYVPTGGTILAHNANTRVYIRKAEHNNRIARLFDSSWLPEGEAVFCITERGIEDGES